MPEPSSKIHLKKYSNRRLYDTEKSVYVTLIEVAEMVKQGRWVNVTDVDSGDDVTAFTLTQIVMEEAKKKNALLPVPLLHIVIRYGETIKETIIDTGKRAYNYNLDVLNAVQDPGEKALNTLLDQATWINGEHRKAVDNWIETVKDGQNNVKTVIETNFKTFERLLGGL